MTTRVLLVSAIASGQGKTTVTAALARYFMRQGQRVAVFKTGADFLDALILERACGHPVQVLDLWMVGEAECRRLLDEAVRGADVVLIEGVMGLYDGVPSSADLARAFDLAVLAVIDVRAMAQTVGAVAAGLRDYGAIRLAGVIANGVAGDGHRAMVSSALRDIPLVATLPRQAASLPERHLGLSLPGENDAIDAQLDALGRALALDARIWDGLAADRTAEPGCLASRAPTRLLAGLRVAVARDAAFAFLYPANIGCLERLGAAVSFFSPLAGEPVPADATAVFLPGGYPELYAQTLSQAVRFHESIRAAHAADVPIIAECGGMMALAESLGDTQGRQWPMAGLLAGRTHMQSRVAALGLQAWKTKLGELRGHTFHYSIFDSPLIGAGQTIAHPRGTPGEIVYRLGTLTASYFHAYFNSCPRAIAALLRGSDP
jgi:cobyrinic acid a,c-diamide synthase